VHRTELLRDRPPGRPPTTPPKAPGFAARLLRYAAAGPRGSLLRQTVTTVALIAGAGLVAASAAIHLHLWASGYRTIPTIGPLFLFQGVAGAVLAVALVAWRRLIMAVAAVGFLLATIGGLLLSAYVGLFGFMDPLSAPFAGLSLAVESAGTLILVAVSAELLRGAVVRSRREAGPSGDPTSVSRDRTVAESSSHGV
jgi:hypothetical protein